MSLYPHPVMPALPITYAKSLSASTSLSSSTNPSHTSLKGYVFRRDVLRNSARRHLDTMYSMGGGFLAKITMSTDSVFQAIPASTDLAATWNTAGATSPKKCISTDCGISLQERHDVDGPLIYRTLQTERSISFATFLAEAKDRCVLTRSIN